MNTSGRSSLNRFASLPRGSGATAKRSSANCSPRVKAVLLTAGLLAGCSSDPASDMTPNKTRENCQVTVYMLRDKPMAELSMRDMEKLSLCEELLKR